MTTIIYHYTGDGNASLPGVPARDLTAADVESLSRYERQSVQDSGLYTTASVAPAMDATIALGAAAANAAVPAPAAPVANGDSAITDDTATTQTGRRGKKQTNFQGD